MKSIVRIVVAFTALMVASLGIFLVLVKETAYDKRDIVHYNDQLYKVENDLAGGLSEEEIEAKYGCDIIMSKEINDPELAQFYASGALVLDLALDGEYVGKVAWNDIRKSYEKAGEAFFRASFILWLAVLFSGYVIIFIMFFSFIKPIEDLEGFAQNIAKGDLDKPIPMRKNTLYAAFVEGFDLMREQLKESIDRERKAEIARKELIQGLSHDIKTPLAVIKATCEVLALKLARSMETIPANEKEEYLGFSQKIESIADKADTISSLMTDVMHANLEELEKVAVIPTEEKSIVVEEFLRNLSDYGNIILENSIYPCLVYIDKRRMEQVIDNIVGNSYKYAKTDIRVSFSETGDISLADGGTTNFIKVIIRDEGPGVDAEDLPLLAEKYYRGKNAASESGYGLGMYLCRLYMERQGGGMEFYNDNGFVVELLLRKV